MSRSKHTRWRRSFVEDRAQVWFGVDRVTRSEGRAAARRGKNAIKLIPTQSHRTYAFDEACLITLGAKGRSLTRANLAKGPRQLIVLADEEHVDLAAENTQRLARTIHRANLDLPAARDEFVYHYRLTATIALAEIARQVGTRSPKARKQPRPPIYDRALQVLAEEAGETVDLEDLLDY